MAALQARIEANISQLSNFKEIIEDSSRSLDERIGRVLEGFTAIQHSVASMERSFSHSADEATLFRFLALKDACQGFESALGNAMECASSGAASASALSSSSSSSSRDSGAARIASLSDRLEHALLVFLSGDVSAQSGVIELMQELDCAISELPHEQSHLVHGARRLLKSTHARIQEYLGEASAAAATGKGAVLTLRSERQLVKPITFFGAKVADGVRTLTRMKNPDAVARQKEIEKKRALQMAFVAAGFDGTIGIRGDGDCLLRSIYVNLLLQKKEDVLLECIERVDLSTENTLRENTRANGTVYPELTLTPEAKAELVAFLGGIQAGETHIDEVFLSDGHLMDEALCAMLRLALLPALQSMELPDGAEFLRDEAVAQAKATHENLSDLHIRALADTLGIHVHTVSFLEGAQPFARFFDHPDDTYFGISVTTNGPEEAAVDVAVTFTGSGADGHYETMVSTGEEQKLDVIAIRHVLEALDSAVPKRNASGGFDTAPEREQVQEILAELYARCPHTQTVWAHPVQREFALRVWTIIDALRADAESQLGYTLEIPERAPRFALDAHVEAVGEVMETDLVHIPCLSVGDAAKAFHAFHCAPSGETADMLLHHINVAFSADIRGAFYSVFPREHISVDTLGEFFAQLSGVLAEQGDTASAFFGGVWQIYGRECDRGDPEFGKNHCFDSALALQSGLSSIA